MGGWRNSSQGHEMRKGREVGRNNKNGKRKLEKIIRSIMKNESTVTLSFFFFLTIVIEFFINVRLFNFFTRL